MNTLRQLLVIGTFTSLCLNSGCATQKTATASAAGPAEQTQSVAQAAQPAEHADLSGAWNYTMTNDQQEAITGVLTIQKGGSAGYTGRITTNEIGLDSETVITKSQLNGSDFIYEGIVKSPDGDIPFIMTGTIRGNQLEGKNDVQYQGQNLVYKVKATRK